MLDLAIDCEESRDREHRFSFKGLNWLLQLSWQQPEELDSAQIRWLPELERMVAANKIFCNNTR